MRRSETPPNPSIHNPTKIRVFAQHVNEKLLGGSIRRRVIHFSTTRSVQTRSNGYPFRLCHPEACRGISNLHSIHEILRLRCTPLRMTASKYLFGFTHTTPSVRDTYLRELMGPGIRRRIGERPLSCDCHFVFLDGKCHAGRQYRQVLSSTLPGSASHCDPCPAAPPVAASILWTVHAPGPQDPRFPSTNVSRLQSSVFDPRCSFARHPPATVTASTSEQELAWFCRCEDPKNVIVQTIDGQLEGAAGYGRGVDTCLSSRAWIFLKIRCAMTRFAA